MALVEWTTVSDTRNQNLDVLYATVRADAAMTTSYVASSHVRSAVGARLAVLLALTWDSATSVEWYYEWSHDATTWFRTTNISESTGTDTVTAESKTYAISASINLSDVVDVAAAYFRVYVKRTGGSASDTAAITVSIISPKR